MRIFPCSNCGKKIDLLFSYIFDDLYYCNDCVIPKDLEKHKQIIMK